MGSPPDVGALIHLIYDAALDPAGWEPFLVALAQACSTDAAALVHQRLDGVPFGNVAAAAGVDPAALELYGAYFGALDPWAGAMRKRGQLGRDVVVTGEGLVPQRTLHTTEYYNDFARRFGIICDIGCSVETEPHLATCITVLSPRDSRSNSKGHLRLLTALQPHFKRSLMLHQRLHAVQLRASAGEAALDNLSIGVVLLNASRMVFANTEAHRISELRDGLTLTSTSLSASSVPQSRALQLMIRQAHRPQEEISRLATIRISRPSFKKEFLVLVSRLRGTSFISGGPVVGVFISDPETTSRPPAALLQILYGLTNAESRFAEVLARGISVQEVAQEQQLTMNTARWFVRQLLSKTNSRGLPQLIRLLVGDLAGFVRQ